MNRENTMTPSEALRAGELTGSWTLDASRSRIRLRTRVIWGIVPVSGVFQQVSGEGVVTPAGEPSGTVTVAAASVDTGNARRDEHLRSAAFLHVEEYPEIVFAVRRVEPADLTLVGDLTIRGHSHPVSFGVRVSRAGGDEVHLDGEAHVDRAAFGLTWNPLNMASMDNVIDVHAVFIRESPASG